MMQVGPDNKKIKTVQCLVLDIGCRKWVVSANVHNIIIQAKSKNKIK